METKQINLEEYTDIIGSGGFGLIVKHKDGDKVVKLLYNTKACLSAEEESSRHKLVYEKITEIVKNTPNALIFTSKPLAFSEKDIVHHGKHYRCAYTMTYIPSIPEYNNLIHIIFKEEYESSINKVVGKRYSEPPSDDNPPRGFFATASFVEKNILPRIPNNVKGKLKTINDIATRMGLLYGTCIFGANLAPIDAEYVLSVVNGKLHVTILDFGMFELIKLKNFLNGNQAKKTLEGHVRKFRWDIEEIDLYFPYKDSKYWTYFLTGIIAAFKFFVPRVKDIEIKESLMYIGTELLYSHMSGE